MNRITGEIRETIIHAVLETLDTAHPRAMTLPMLRTAAGRATGLAMTEEEARSLLADMAEQGWVAEQRAEAAAEVVRYQRTAAGRDVLMRLRGGGAG